MRDSPKSNLSAACVSLLPLSLVSDRLPPLPLVADPGARTKAAIIPSIGVMNIVYRWLTIGGC